MKMLPSTKFALASLTLLWGVFTASAVDYNWATGATGGTWNTSSNWSPSGPPTSSDNASIVMTTSSQVISVNGTVGNATVGNLSIGLNTGNSLSIDGAVVGSQSLTISGNLTKTNTTGTVNFVGNSGNGSTSFQLNLAVGTINMTGGGTFNFGTATRKLQSLVVNSGVIMSNNDGTRAAIISSNLNTDYSLGEVTFSGNGSKTLNLTNSSNLAFSAYSRSITVSGINQTSGSNATINGAFAGSQNGTAATLIINTATGQSYSTYNVFSDGAAGSTLSISKSGAGTQTLSGANSFSGNTTVSAGTLLLSNATGSGLGTSNVTVNGGTLGGNGSFTGNVIVNAGGTLAPGASIESLGAGGVTINGGTFAFELNTSGSPNADLLFASDNTVALSITTGVPTLTVTDLGSNIALAEGTKFTLISYTALGGWNNGIFSGYADDSTFTLGNNKWKINYNDLSAGSNFTTDAQLFGDRFVTVTVVPEPATWGLLAFSLTTVMVLRRRRA